MSNTTKCPNCRSEAEAKCCGQDIDQTDDCHDYFLVWCEECGHVEAIQKYGGNSSSKDWVNECPYCKIEAIYHGPEIPEGIKELVGSWETGVLRQGSSAI